MGWLALAGLIVAGSAGTWAPYEPGIWAPTVRAMHAVVEGFDGHGKPITVEGTGLMARCLQHEVDHLDGKLFLDRLTGEARKTALRALRSR